MAYSKFYELGRLVYNLNVALERGVNWRTLLQKARLVDKFIGDENENVTQWVLTEWYENLVRGFKRNFIKRNSRGEGCHFNVTLCRHYHSRFLSWFSKDFDHPEEERKEYLIEVTDLYESAIKRSKNPDEKAWFEVRMRNFIKRYDEVPQHTQD